MKTAENHTNIMSMRLSLVVVLIAVLASIFYITAL